MEKEARAQVDHSEIQPLPASVVLEVPGPIEFFLRSSQFLELQQEGFPVALYWARFQELSRFAPPVMVN